MGWVRWTLWKWLGMSEYECPYQNDQNRWEMNELNEMSWIEPEWVNWVRWTWWVESQSPYQSPYQCPYHKVPINVPINVPIKTLSITLKTLWNQNNYNSIGTRVSFNSTTYYQISHTWRDSERLRETQKASKRLEETRIAFEELGGFTW